MRELAARRPYTAEILQGFGAGVAAQPVAPPVASTVAAAAAPELVDEVRQLRQEIVRLTAREQTQDEYLTMRTEIARMVRSLTRAKAEIAAIKHPDAHSDRMERATAELSEVVNHTESATGTILESAETILVLADQVDALSGDEDVMAITGDLRGRATRIMEACNFQDMTSQRVTKVVQTLTFIEGRIRAIIEEWGASAFCDLPIPAAEQTHSVDPLVNGPSNGTSALSQAEIDALFA